MKAFKNNLPVYGSRKSRKVSEAKVCGGVIKRPRLAQGVRLALAAPLLAGSLLVSDSLLALPQGGEIVGGSGNIAQVDANTTHIDQATHRMAVEWQTFDLDTPDTVNIYQPSASAVILNRILDQKASEIRGSINANGQVIIANPNGLVFTDTAKLDVHSAVLSGHSIATNDFMEGGVALDGGQLAGTVINQGVIEAATGGGVIMTGGSVSNQGLIAAKAGTVELAAGNAATLDFSGDGMLRFQIDEQAIANGEENAVHNSGTIKGGTVLLTAKAARDAFTAVVNNEGMIKAERIDAGGGVIRLIAGGGTVINAGTLDASADEGTGGEIDVLGDQVGIVGTAIIDASGADGGGYIRIGGDFQGKNPEVKNATHTFVGPDATILADAGEQGDGGRVIVWANESTTFQGEISVTGGRQGGDGGFVEVSGKERLAYLGHVRATAESGSTGTLLLDPDNIQIVAEQPAADLNGDGTLGDDLASASIDFADDAGNDSVISAGAVQTQLASASVTLQAHDDIAVNAAINDASGAGNALTLQAGDDIFVNQSITLHGNLILSAGDGSATPVAPDGTADISINGDVVVSGGNILFTSSGGDVVVNNNVAATSGHVSLVAGNRLDQNAIVTAGQDIYFEAGAGGIDMTGVSTTSGSNALYTSAGNIILGHLNATDPSASISLVAGGSITDGDADENHNLTATNVRLEANGIIGGATPTASDINRQAINLSATNVAARAGTGIYLQADGALNIETVGGVSVTEVYLDQSTATVPSPGQTTLSGLTTTGGPIKVKVGENLNINAAVDAGGVSDILLASGATLSSTAAGAIDSGGGHISLTAATGISQGANVSTSRDGDIYYEAGVGGINMSGVTTTSGDDAFYTTIGDIILGHLDATDASISLVASGDITDGDNDENPNLTASDVRLESGGIIGGAIPGASDTNTQAIDLAATTVAASAATGIYLQDGDALEIGDVGGLSVSEAYFESGTAAAPTAAQALLSGLTTTDAATGPIKVKAGGNLDVNAAVDAGSASDILLASGATLSSTAAGTIDSAGGHISLTATTGIRQAANVSTSEDGNIYYEAGVGGINMTGVTTASGDDAFYTTTGDIILGHLDATDASISLVAGGKITDGDNNESPNLTASEVRLESGGIIGGATPSASDTNTQAIDLAATTVAASAATGIYLQDGGALEIGEVVGVGVSEAYFDSDTADAPTAAQATLSGLTTTNGPIKVKAGGNLDVNAGVNAGGVSDILLASGGTLTSAAAGTIGSGGGHISLTATTGIRQAANVSTSGDGDIYYEAGTDGIDMTGVTTTSGDDAFYTTTGDIILGHLDATDASISLVAGGKITDGNADENPNLTATNVRLESGGMIGKASGQFDHTNEQAIDLAADVVAASAATGIYLQDGNALEVGDVAGVSVDEVFFDSDKDPAPNPAQTTVSGLTTTGGPIKVKAGGGLVVDSAIDAGGASDVLLYSGATLTLNATGTVDTGGGDVGLIGDNGVVINSLITTNGGSIYCQSGGGMCEFIAPATNFATSGGDMAFIFNDDVSLGVMDFGGGNIRIETANSILDANGSDLNITAGGLQLIAGGMIGGAGNLPNDTNDAAIDLKVDYLTAKAGGSVYVQSDQTLTVDEVSVDVSEIFFDSGSRSLSASQSDISTDDGVIKLVAETGNIQLNSGAGVDDPAISAKGSQPDVLLRADDGDIVINGESQGDIGVSSDGGHITLIASNAIYQYADVKTSGSGTIYYFAGGLIDMDEWALTATDDGHVLYVSEGGINLGQINANADGDSIAGNVGLKAHGDIVDINGTANNVTASGLIMIADADGDGSGIIGGFSGAQSDTNDQAIDTDVDTLAASAADGIYVLESDGVTVDRVSVEVQEVHFDSGLIDVPDLELEDVETTAGPIKLKTSAGHITLKEGGDLDGHAVSAGDDDLGSPPRADVLLLAAGDLIQDADADILSNGGHISLLAGDDIFQNADVTTSGAGTVYYNAANASDDATTKDGILMAAGTVTTAGGDVIYIAGDTADGGMAVNGDIELGQISASGSRVSLEAERHIIDANASIVNVTADVLRMVADSDGLIGDDSAYGRIGGPATPRLGGDTNANAIDVDLDGATDENGILAASAAEGIYIQESNGVIVTNASGFSVEHVRFDSDTTQTTASDLADLETSNGPIKLKTLLGDITLEEGGDEDSQSISAGGANDVLLLVARDLIQSTDADILSSGGHISLVAGDDIFQNAAVTTSRAGTVYYNAANASDDTATKDGILMAAGTVTTAGGDVIYIAGDPADGGTAVDGDIELGRIIASDSRVSLEAERHILDANASTSIVNVTSAVLRMVADSDDRIDSGNAAYGRIGGPASTQPGIDTNANAINTDLDSGLNENGVLAATAVEGIYIQESDGVIVANASGFDVDRVRFDSSATPTTAPDLADLETSNGPIKLKTLAGDITLEEGGDLDDHAVSAGDLDLENPPSADILLLAEGSLIQNANADILSNRGDISLIAGNDIRQRADVTTSDAGTVFYYTGNGSILMVPGTVTTGGGNVLYNSADAIEVAKIVATDQGVSLRADGDITDANEDETVNIIASILRLEADADKDGAGIIGGATPSASDINVQAIDTDVTTVAANAATGIYLQELDTTTQDGLTVDATGGISVNRVYFDSVAKIDDNGADDDIVSEHASLADLETVNGPIKVKVVANDLTLNEGGDLDGHAVNAGGAGDILLWAAAVDGNVILNTDNTDDNNDGHLTTPADATYSEDRDGDVKSGSGHISLIAGAGIDQNADVNTRGGTVYYEAGTGGIDMASHTDTTSGGGNVLYKTTGRIELGLIDAGVGSISLEADGDITDNNGSPDDNPVIDGLETMNLKGDAVRLVADADANGEGIIGGKGDTANDINLKAIDTRITTLAASSATGIYIQEADGVTVDATGPIEISKFYFDSGLGPVSAALEDLTTTNGPIKLKTDAGNITLNSGVGPGGFSVRAGDLDLANSPSADILLLAEGSLIQNNDADIWSNGGDISLIAGSNILQGGDVTTSDSGMVFYHTSNGNIDMAAGTATTAGGNVLYNSAGVIKVANIVATDQSVSLKADGDITDANADETVNITAATLRLESASGRIGGATPSPSDTNVQAIGTDVTTVAANAATGIYLQELDTISQDGLTVDATGGISVNRVYFDSFAQIDDNEADDGIISQHADLSDLTTSGGPIKVVTLANDLTVTDGNDGDGISVSAGGANDILLDSRVGNVIQSSGDIISGGGNISLTAGLGIDQDANVTTSDAGTVYYQALSGDIDMAPGTVTTSGGNALYDASGNILLAEIMAAGQRVSLKAGGNISDANNDESVNVTAATLRLDAGGMIGNGGGAPSDANVQAIDTDVTSVAATSATGIYLQEIDTTTNDGLTVAGIGDIGISEARFDSGNSPVSHADLSDLTTSGGPIKVVTLANDLTVSDGNDGDGISVSAGGANDILLDSRLGNVIQSSGDIVSGGGNISLTAGLGIDQDANVTTSGAGTIYYQAIGGNIDMAPGAVTTSGGNALYDATGDILLAKIMAAGQSVSLKAGGNISDANNDESVNVTAAILRLEAGGMIGNGGGAPSDANAQAIDTDVTSVAATSATGIYLQEIDTTTNDGLTVAGIGDIGISQARFNSDNSPVSHAVLSDLTTSGGPIKVVTLANDLTVTDGNDGDGLSVSAGGANDILLGSRAGDVIQNSGDIVSDGGHISLTAGLGIDQGANVTTSGGGTIYYRAGSGGIVMQQGSNTSTQSRDIFMDSGGSIQLTSVSAGSANVGLQAEGAISDANGADVNVSAGSLAITAGGSVGGGSGAESDDNVAAIDVAVGTLGASAGGGLYIQDIDQLVVGTASASVQEAKFDSGTVAQGLSESGLGSSSGPIKVKASGGNLDLTAAATAGGSSDILLQASGTLNLDAPVTSGGGNISLIASEISQNSTVNTDGGAYYRAGGFTMTGGSVIDAGSILLELAGTAQLGAINSTGTVALVKDEARGVDFRITDGNGEDVNITAEQLLLEADQIGASTDAIEIEVGTLAAHGAQGVYLDEASGLIVGDVTATTERVWFASGTTPITEALTAVEASAGDVVLNAQAGNIEIASYVLAETDATLTATGVIHDSNDGDDSVVDVIAENLYLEAGEMIGSVSETLIINALDTQVETVTAEVAAIVGEESGLPREVSGSIYIREDDSITARELTSHSGSVYLQTGGGALLIDDTGINAQHDIFLEANAGNTRGDGGDGDIDLNANVKAALGSVHLVAADDVLQRTGVRVTTETGTEDGLQGSIYYRAENAHTDSVSGIHMEDGAVLDSKGHVIMEAVGEGDILLGLISASSQAVSLEAEGSILDNNGEAVNVQAERLRMVANRAKIVGEGDFKGTIGTRDEETADHNLNANAINLDVDLVAAKSSEGIYLLEEAGLKIGDAGTMAVKTLDFTKIDTVPNTTQHGNLAGMETTYAGAVKVVAKTGGMELLGDHDQGRVLAHGDVLLRVGGYNEASESDLLLNASVVSYGPMTAVEAVAESESAQKESREGNIAIEATGQITQNAVIHSMARGDVYIKANRLVMPISDDGGEAISIGSAGGNIFVDVIDELVLGVVNANLGSDGTGGGNVLLRSQQGGIVDGHDLVEGVADDGITNVFGSTVSFSVLGVEPSGEARAVEAAVGAITNQVEVDAHEIGLGGTKGLDLTSVRLFVKNVGRADGSAPIGFSVRVPKFDSNLIELELAHVPGETINPPEVQELLEEKDPDLDLNRTWYDKLEPAILLPPDQRDEELDLFGVDLKLETPLSYLVTRPVVH